MQVVCRWSIGTSSDLELVIEPLKPLQIHILGLFCAHGLDPITQSRPQDRRHSAREVFKYVKRYNPAMRQHANRLEMASHELRGFFILATTGAQLLGRYPRWKCVNQTKRASEIRVLKRPHEFNRCRVPALASRLTHVN